MEDDKPIGERWRECRAEIQKPGADLTIEQLAQYRIPYWIDLSGRIVDLEGTDHARSAMAMLKKWDGVEVGPDEAVESLIDQDWLRVQAYPDETLFVQGTYVALVSRGDNILKIMPDFKSVEIAYVPADYKNPPSFTINELDRMGWVEAVQHAMRVGKFGKRARRT